LPGISSETGGAPPRDIPLTGRILVPGVEGAMICDSPVQGGCPRTAACPRNAACGPQPVHSRLSAGAVPGHRKTQRRSRRRQARPQGLLSADATSSRVIWPCHPTVALSPRRPAPSARRVRPGPGVSFAAAARPLAVGASAGTGVATSTSAAAGHDGQGAGGVPPPGADSRRTVRLKGAP
jgi:hypothetical protein